MLYNEKRKILFVKQVPTKLHLNFVGHVVRLGTVGSLPCCKAFGLQFFIEGSGFADIDKPLFIPAWMIPSAEKTKGLKKQHNEYTVLELSAKTDLVDFAFVWHKGAKKMMQNVVVTLHSLAVPLDARAGSLSSQDGAILVRQAIPAQLKNADKPKSVVPRKPGAAASLAKPKASVRHMFT